MKRTLRRSGVGNEAGITLIEVLIGLVLAALVGGASLQFYQAQHEVYLAQSDTSDRQGNVRYALNELARQVRRAGFMVPSADYVRVSTQRDTLTVFIGNGGGATVDTISYYVNRAATVPALVKKVNDGAAQVFAEAIDTALFVPASVSPIHDVVIALISTPQKQYTSTSLSTRRRASMTVHLRNR